MNFNIQNSAWVILLCGIVTWTASAQDPAAPGEETSAPLEETAQSEVPLVDADTAPPISDDPLIRELNSAISVTPNEAQQGDTPSPFGGSSLFSPKPLLQTFAVLCIVVASIILLLNFVRRLGERTPLLASANLGKVLGRIHLDRRGTSLHFVETGNAVLVVGVTTNSISLVAQFDQASFDAAEEEIEDVVLSAQGEFAQDLQASSTAMNQGSDNDIDALRDNIQRLQRSIREDERENLGD